MEFFLPGFKGFFVCFFFFFLEQELDILRAFLELVEAGTWVFFPSQGISGLEDRPAHYGLWPDLNRGNGEKEEGSLSYFPPNLTLPTGPVHLGQRDTGFTKENEVVTPRASRVDRRRGLKRGSSNHSSSRLLFTQHLCGVFQYLRNNTLGRRQRTHAAQQLAPA